jgi:hypothetical protein
MKCEHTSERVGTEAAQLLRSKRSSNKVRSVAGSALSQRKNAGRARKRSSKRG